MTPGIKKMLIGSIGVSAVVGILAIVDVAMGTPFGGQTMLDIMFDLPDNQGSSYVINERNVEGVEPVLPIREARTKSA